MSHISKSDSILGNNQLTQNIGFFGILDDICCCQYFSHEQITAKISTPKSGFVPGEEIEFDAEVYNQSNRKIDSSYVQLVQNIEHSFGPLTIENVIAQTQKQGK